MRRLERDLQEYILSQIKTLQELKTIIDEMAADPATSFAAGRLSSLHDQLAESIVRISFACGALTK